MGLGHSEKSAPQTQEGSCPQAFWNKHGECRPTSVPPDGAWVRFPAGLRLGFGGHGSHARAVLQTPRPRVARECTFTGKNMYRTY